MEGYRGRGVGGGVERGGGVEGWRWRVGVESGACGYPYRTEPKIRNTCIADSAEYRISIGIDCTTRLQP